MFAKLKRAAKGAFVPHTKATANMTTVKMPVPSRIVMPMQQHIGSPCTPTVHKGDTVFVGTVIGQADSLISANIHSSVSGVVEGIDRIALANGGSVDAVSILPDGAQRLDSNCKPPIVTDAKGLVDAAYACGLVGLGGAGFPTAVKLSPKEPPIDTLIINGAECEPYISSDNREFLECSDTVMRGIQAVCTYLNIPRVIIALERNKPEAIDLMFSLTRGDSRYIVKPLPSRYPQGAEKVLIEKVIGREVPRGGLPADIGVLVMNVTTVSTLGKFLETGIPLVSRRITVDGDAVLSPQNVEVLLGTPMCEILDFCGGVRDDFAKLLMGGPMMGIAVPDLNLPVIKQNNALLAFSESKAHLPEMSACIRCGRCIDACPMGLSPVELAGAFMQRDTAALQNMMIDLCINCGSCTYVCPAKRPVSQTMSLAKGFYQKEAKLSHET